MSFKLADNGETHYFAVFSLLVSLFLFPCGAVLLLKDSKALRVGHKAVGFWFPFTLNSENEAKFILLEIWYFQFMALLLGVIGSVSSHFFPLLGTYLIVLASGWSLADNITIFLGFKYVEIMLPAVMSLSGVFLFRFRPKWLKLFMIWMGAQLFIGSVKLFVVALSIYNTDNEFDPYIMSVMLNLGCFLSIIMVVTGSMLGLGLDIVQPE